MTDARRRIPSISRMIESEAFASLRARAPHELVVAAARAAQDAARADAANAPNDVADYALAAEQWLDRALRPSLRPVINATGVVLHTNLGRAPLAEDALDAMRVVAGGYSNLEYDLERGARGSRYDHCTELLCELTGAEAALVVNNAAAALVLALQTFAHHADVLVSRGELVEIGDGFRVPEIIERSGAHMREVGATNRTHLRDYVRALEQVSEGRNAHAILKVHRSNFRMTGFTAEADPADLAALAAERGITSVYDLGSGLLLDAASLGLPPEPDIAQAVQTGFDVVAFSCDKLLGGPQAGAIVGRKDSLQAMRRNPLCRALRVDKLTLSALEATLRLYRDPDHARTRVPTLRYLTVPTNELHERASMMQDALGKAGIAVEVVESAGAVGGGACPDVVLPGWAVALSDLSASRLDAALRAGIPPVVGRTVDDRLLLDLRTVEVHDDRIVVDAVRAAVAAVQ